MKQARSLAAILLLVLVTDARAQNIREDRDFFRPSTRQWSFDLSVSSLFDSNIERDEREQNAQGVESGFVARYRDRGRRHRFWIRYKGGAQFYNHTDRWNGGRSNLEAVLERNLGSRFILGGIGGHSLKVSSDDRELTHKLTATPIVEYEITDSTRLLTYGGFELRRPADAEDVQRIRTIGAEVATEIGDVSLLRFGYEYETSESERSSRRYDRSTLVGGYDADFGRTRLRFELEYRDRRYPDRLVDIGELPVPRLDGRFIPSASWDHEFPGGHRLRLKYEYESRTSNDPGKAFRGQRVEFSVRVPLTGRVAVRPSRRVDVQGLTPSGPMGDDVRVLSEHEEFRQLEARYFSRGSSWKELLQAQGVPSNISERPRFYEELWFYADSWVVLKNGRVISWHDAGNLRLAPERVERPRNDGAKVNPDPKPLLRKAGRLETVTDAAARAGNGKSEDRVSVSPPARAEARSAETPSMAAARIAPSEIVLRDGTRIEGRLQKYENGLAYIIITVGPKRKSLLTTLPEHLIDKEATDRENKR